jgi:hypothetical protein
VLVYTAIANAITVIFKANVNSQAGAYATGVLAMMVSAALAVTVVSRRAKRPKATFGFGIVTLILAYALVANAIEKPDGIVMSGAFIAGIIVVSLVSRISRTTELRADQIELDERAQAIVEKAAHGGALHVIANQRQAGNADEYRDKEAEQRAVNPIPDDAPIVFLEVDVSDPSEFSTELCVRGVDVEGYQVLRVESPVIPNTLAAILLYLRDTTGLFPQCYFDWAEGSPLVHIVKYLLLGQGDTAPVTREVLRQAEPDPKRRPGVHVGG